MKSMLRLLFVFAFFGVILSLSLPDGKDKNESAPNESVSDDSDEDKLNSTAAQDLFVIKTVVYEVGILTDPSNDTDNVNETREQINVSLYGAPNDTLLNLSDILLPIQNLTGQVKLAASKLNSSSWDLREQKSKTDSQQEADKRGASYGIN